MSTSIEEKEYDKQINITKYKFTCDDIDEKIPKPLPQQGGFGLLIIGKPGVGKTCLILSLVCKQGKGFNRRFEKVFVISPSLMSLDDDPFELIPEDQKFDTASFENLNKILEDIKDTGEKVLLILDDVICETRGKGCGAEEKLLQKIFFNRRHLTNGENNKGGSCSIIATSQSYHKIDPKLRKTASHIIQFKPQKKEAENLYDDMIEIPKKEFYDVMRYIYDKKHNFMYIDTTLKDNESMHKNFNQLIVKSPNITTDFQVE